jgi:hypothetical protein
MSKSDWQVGPVLKDKLGSQGTLFRGGTKYSSDARYPRGYTPERQAEVADAVVQPSVKAYFDRPNEVSTGTQSTNFKDRRVTVGPGRDKYPEGYRMESRQDTRRLVDNIARSTVPVEHISGVQFRTNHTDQMLGENVAGHYSRPGDAMSKGEPVIRLREGFTDGHTPIHEIGHHVSRQVGNEFPRDETGHSGQEESFADNYAEQHFRDAKGRPVERGTYGGGQYSGHIERTEDFWKGYHKDRDNSLYHASVAAQNEDYYHRYPEEKVHPGNTIQDPLITKSWVSEEDFKKHGERPEIDINPEAEHWSHKYAW